MTVGCLITVNAERKVVLRQPLWPWPKPGVYPITTSKGETIYFFPVGYWRFRLGDRLEVSETIHLELEPLHHV